VKRGSFAPCEGCWCGVCYKPLGARKFPIRQKFDEDGEVLTEEDEDERFKAARAGDYLMIPFQCELCHFRNILGRDPDRNDSIISKAWIL
jgi:hypothetical protein